MSCSGESLAWIAGSGGAVRKTTNGGSTWTAQSTGTGQTLYGSFAVDASRVRVVGLCKRARHEQRRHDLDRKGTPTHADAQRPRVRRGLRRPGRSAAAAPSSRTARSLRSRHDGGRPPAGRPFRLGRSRQRDAVGRRRRPRRRRYLLHRRRRRAQRHHTVRGDGPGQPLHHLLVGRPGGERGGRPVGLRQHRPHAADDRQRRGQRRACRRRHRAPPAGRRGRQRRRPEASTGPPARPIG